MKANKTWIQIQKKSFINPPIEKLQIDIGSPQLGDNTLRVDENRIPSEKINQDLNLPKSQSPMNMESPSDLKKRDKEKENKNDLTDDAHTDYQKSIKFLERNLIGKNFYDSFLLFKFQINDELFRLSKSTQNLSKNLLIL